MSDYTPKVGHRVKASRVITWRGVVTRVAPAGFNVKLDDEPVEIFLTDHDGPFTVERLPDPEPEWQHGDVVLANGYTYEWDADIQRWRIMGSGARLNDDELSRPLIPLVRDGKRWAGAVGGAR